jgi:hypothetical protein
LEKCAVYLRPWGPLDEKDGFIETSLSRVIHGRISKLDSLLKGKVWSQKDDPFQIARVFSKGIGVLEMSSLLDILGILSEQTRFSITVHRFRDSLDSFRIPFRYSQTSGSL